MIADNKGMETITIRNRQYTVGQQTFKGANGEPKTMWTLTGKRGAVWGTMRNVNSGLLFCYTGAFQNKTLDRVWLTDKNGKLEVVAQ